MADSDLCSTSQWIQFFRNAGLPTNVAANYALIFSDNRIQQNMLMDLSKEYLYDMGIKVMGDVIAILRYSKEFHNQLAKEKIIGGSSDPPPLSSRRGSPATRILEHYTRPAVGSPKRPAPESVSLPKIHQVQTNKRSLVISPSEAIKNSDLLVKKARRVPPEEEGAYKIKMPSGTTERSRKILELQNLHNSSKKSVFDRLGDSDVSSSTDVKRNISSGSVFKRLGPSSSEVITSTIEPTPEPPLSYRGVLKTTKSKQVIRIKSSPSPAQSLASRQRKSVISSPLLRGITKPSQQMPLLKRTVISRSPATRGVVQIKSILQQNAALNIARQRSAASAKATGAHRNMSIMNRLGATKTATIPTGNDLRNAVVLTKLKRQSNSRNSVFQRLGK